MCREKRTKPRASEFALGVESRGWGSWPVPRLLPWLPQWASPPAVYRSLAFASILWNTRVKWSASGKSLFYIVLWSVQIWDHYFFAGFLRSLTRNKPQLVTNEWEQPRAPSRVRPVRDLVLLSLIKILSVSCFSPAFLRRKYSAPPLKPGISLSKLTADFCGQNFKWSKNMFIYLYAKPRNSFNNFYKKQCLNASPHNLLVKGKYCTCETL